LENLTDQDVKDIMSVVSGCAEDLYPDDIVQQALHINNSYNTLLNLIEASQK